MQTKTPKISVLMSAYNSEKYISESIESILNQTFKDFEFIIINDGSSDNTAKIIQKYAEKDERIRFINSKQNQGIIAALNPGFSMCRGEYIARMDSDDISLPKRFEKQIEYMDKHSECGVLGTSIIIFDKENSKEYIQKERIKFFDLLQSCCIVNPSVMLRKSVLLDNNILYRPQYIHAEDYGMWSELIKLTEIHNLQDVLLKYRWHGGNVSCVYESKQIQTAKEIQSEMLHFLTDVKEVENIILKAVRISKFYNKRNLNKHMLIHHPFRYLKLKRS